MSAMSNLDGRRACKVDGCDGRFYCRGMCSMHYQRFRATGTTDPRPRLTVDDRYERDVVRRGEYECWGWTGQLNSQGYPVITFSKNNKTQHVLMHRYSVTRSGRELPKGKVVRHTCDNPPCTNPAHLLIGTQAENMADAMARGRLNKDGLALGRTYELPPRPCRDCGIHLNGGRNQLCAPCKKKAQRESKNRWAAKGKAA